MARTGQKVLETKNRLTKVIEPSSNKKQEAHKCATPCSVSIVEEVRVCALLGALCVEWESWKGTELLIKAIHGKKWANTHPLNAYVGCSISRQLAVHLLIVDFFVKKELIGYRNLFFKFAKTFKTFLQIKFTSARDFEKGLWILK